MATCITGSLQPCQRGQLTFTRFAGAHIVRAITTERRKRSRDNGGKDQSRFPRFFFSSNAYQPGRRDDDEEKRNGTH